MTVNRTSNSTLSQDVVERILVGPLAQRTSFLGLRIPEYVSDGQPIHIPTVSSVGTATGVVAEGSQIPEASLATSEAVLLPSTVYAMKAIVKMTNEAISTSVVNLETAMANAITTRVSGLIDSALYNGAGSNGTALGLFGITGFTNAGTVAGTALASSNLYTMQESYALAYADSSSGFWAMHPTTYKRIRALEDTGGHRLFEPNIAAGSPNTLFGLPYVVTAYAPSTALILADRNQLAVGRAPASVTVLDQTYADYDITALRVVVRYDVKALNAPAIVKLTLT